MEGAIMALAVVNVMLFFTYKVTSPENAYPWYAFCDSWPTGN